MASLLNPKTMAERISPGGIDPERFDVTTVWYPVFYLDDLDKAKLTPFTLLDTNLVIWWEQNTASWRAFVDQCPHRLAPLSQGRINAQGLLECPYHGWTFAGDGHCETIPQQKPGGQAHTTQRACARSLPTCVKQGLLFVYLGNAQDSAETTHQLANKTPVPTVDVLDDDSPEWVCLNTFRDIPYDAFTLMENVLDSSHIPYTHHRTVGDRANVGPVELELVSSDRQGFSGIWLEGPRRGTLGRQSTTFVAPGLMWHDLTSQKFGRTLTVVYATPIGRGKCRLFARFPFKFGSKIPWLALKLTPRWYSHLGQNRVLEDDQIFLHFQERYLEQKGSSKNYEQACYLPTKADLFVAELRRWMTHYQVDAFPGQSLAIAWDTEALLERYHSHTQHCASCRGALANLQKLRRLGAAIAILVLVALPILVLGVGTNLILGVLASVFFTLGTGLWFGLGKLERSFYQGDPIPPRNQRES